MKSFFSVAHRLHLGIREAINEIPYFFRVESLIQGIYSFYNFNGHKRLFHYLLCKVFNLPDIQWWPKSSTFCFYAESHRVDYVLVPTFCLCPPLQLSSPMGSKNICSFGFVILFRKKKYIY